MATVEGKIVTKMCDLCDGNQPIIHCDLCESDMCGHCEKGHSRNKYTKDHATVPFVITDNENKNEQKIMCTDHLDNEAHLGCRKCDVLICELCLKKHEGHDVKYVADDREFLSKIQNKLKHEVSSKLNILQGQCKVANGFLECSKFGVATAEKVKSEIIETISSSMELIKFNLGRVAKQQDKLIFNKEHGLEPLIRYTNNRLTCLENTPESGNSEEIVITVAELHSLSQKLSKTKDHLHIKADISTVEMLLPNITDTSKAMAELVRIFVNIFQLNLDMVEKRTSLGIPFDYLELEKIHDMYLLGKNKNDVLHVSHCKYYNDCNKVTLYQNNNKTTYLFDINTRTMKTRNFTFSPEFMCGMAYTGFLFERSSNCFWSFNTMYEGEISQIMKEFNEKITKLEGEISAIGCNDGETVVCGTLHDGNIDFIYNGKDSRGHQQILHFLVRLPEQPTSIQIRNKIATLTSKTSIFQFPWPDYRTICNFPPPPAESPIKVTTKVITQDITGEISTVHVDQYDNVLIGDTGGNIHWYDQQWKHQVILSIETPIHGIRPISGGRMIVTSNDSAMIYG